MNYALFSGSSDCQWGYYFFKGSEEEIVNQLYEVISIIVDSYFDISDFQEIIDRREEFEDEWYCELDDLVSLISGDAEVAKHFSMTISDSSLCVEVYTDNEEELLEACKKIDDDLVGSLKGEAAAEAIVNHYSTWLNE